MSGALVRGRVTIGSTRPTSRELALAAYLTGEDVEYEELLSASRSGAFRSHRRSAS